MEEDLDKKWDIHRTVQEAMRTSHPEPSPETRERLKALEVSQQFMVQEISEIKKLVEGLDEKLNCALDKKAGVWVEKVMIWLGIIIGGGLLAYLGNLVIKVIEL